MVNYIVHQFFTEIWLALGCHPKKIQDYEEYSDYHLERAMSHPKVVAVGEFGLDDIGADNHDGIFYKQQEIFKRHVELAIKVNTRSVCPCTVCS